MPFFIPKKAFWLKLKTHIIQNAQKTYLFFRRYVKKLNKRQRKLALILLCTGFFGLLLMSALSIVFKQPKKSKAHIAFQTHIARQPQTQTMQTVETALAEKERLNQALQAQVDSLKTASSNQFQTLNLQLQRIQQALSNVASQDDVVQLQQSAQKPNPALLDKMDDLQTTLKKMATQTAQKHWVNPKTVERYFRLIAIQGFSDGLRAIIDVNGHQTTLTQHEPCPACRGWVLVHMDFANQNAVFVKQTQNPQNQRLYVKLQTN